MHGTANKATWTDARIGTLTAQWAAGYSALLISRELGVTRSSVIGKVHRLKLPERSTLVVAVPSRRSRGHPWSSHNQPKKRFQVGLPPDLPQPFVAHRKAWEALPGTEPVGFMDLDSDTCRWPLGERPFRFCGCKPASGSAYCDSHHALSRREVA